MVLLPTPEAPEIIVASPRSGIVVRPWKPPQLTSCSSAARHWTVSSAGVLTTCSSNSPSVGSPSPTGRSISSMDMSLLPVAGLVGIGAGLVEQVRRLVGRRRVVAVGPLQRLEQLPQQFEREQRLHRLADLEPVVARRADHPTGLATAHHGVRGTLPAPGTAVALRRQGAPAVARPFLSLHQTP